MTLVPVRRMLLALGLGLGVFAALVATFVFVQVRAFESKLGRARLELPARLLARPLELRRGMDVERIGLTTHLRALGYREVEGTALRPGEYARDGARIRLGRSAVPSTSR